MKLKINQYVQIVDCSSIFYFYFQPQCACGNENDKRTLWMTKVKSL